MTPVAVIGMACRLPGGIDSPEALWEALLRGADLVTEVPADRWDADDHYDPEPGLPGRSVGKWGAFLDDVAGFDHEFFGINEREAQSLDPQHRLLLETSWEALEHAGVPSHAVAGSPTGVYVGLTHVDYQLLGSQSPAMAGPYGFQGNAMGMASGRIAHALGVHGPAITVDTACSSSLLAVHMACRSLHDGESDLALAGGAYVMLEPRKFAAASAQNMLSPTGRCRAFDAAADGFVSGEAAAMVLLKRLPDALRDGDRVLAVVRGTAANQDGRTVHIGTPSAQAQRAVYRRALTVAGVDPGTVGMVEAHGPGTPIGDPVEYASLAQVYGVEVPCALASAKTNFGHTQSAAGVLGLMKTVLALQHGAVPQNLHFTRLPDELAAIDTKLFVPQALSAWTTNGGQPRRAAVSAYGLSGTNVHGVLEQAPGALPAPSSDRAGDDAPLLFALSATSPQELRRTAARLAEWVGSHDDVGLPDLAYTLARRRTHRPVRTTVVARDRAQLADALREAAAGDTATYEAVPGRDDRGPVWVFSGQGSQWAGMGAELLANDAVFASTVAEAEPVILRECGFSVREALSGPDEVTGQLRIQPTLFTMQVALAATLRAHGVRPAAVIGHSVGEAAAAVVAGALSLEDGLRVVCRRAVLMSRIAGAGATASVHLPAQQVLSELAVRAKNDVVVAVVPAPEQTVVAGAASTVRELVSAWEERGVAAREIPTDVAFHSPQVDPIVAELTASLADLEPRTPTIPFYSATSYDPRDEPVCDARYWASNMRRMVRFAAAVRAALEDGHRVFAELSPHPVLTHAITQTAGSLDTPVTALATLRRGRRLPGGVLDVVGEMHCAGAAVDFSVLYPNGRLVDAPLPTWTHTRLWLGEDGHPEPARGGHTVSVHPLLGAHVRVPAEPEQHVWQAELGVATHPWLDDHHVHDVPVFPGAGYCEMALAAAGTLLGVAAEVRDVCFEQALLLDDRGTVGAVATHDAPGVFAFAVTSPQQGEQVRHAAATLRAAEDTEPQVHDVAALLAAHPVRHDGAELRERLSDTGLRYGPAFSGLVAVHAGRDGTHTVVAELAPNGAVRAELSAYGVHPAVLDACFQSIAAHPAVLAAAGDAMALPTGIRRLRAYDSARNARYCRARVTGIDATGIDADLEVLDQRGTVLIDVQGLRLTTGEADQRDRVLDERLLGIEWQQRPLPARPEIDPGTWLLVGDPDGDALAAELRDALTGRGARCVDAERLRDQLRGDLTGVVVLLPAPGDDAPDEQNRATWSRVRVPRGARRPRPGRVRRCTAALRRHPRRSGGPRRRPAQPGAGRGTGPAQGDRQRTSGARRDPRRRRRCRRGRHPGGGPTARRVRRGRVRLAQRPVVHRTAGPPPAGPAGPAHRGRRPRPPRGAPARSHSR